MEGDEFVRWRGKPCIQLRVSGSVSAAVGVALGLEAVATDMKAGSGGAMQES